MATTSKTKIAEMTTEIVSSLVSNRTVNEESLVSVIKSVAAALEDITRPGDTKEEG